LQNHAATEPANRATNQWESPSRCATDAHSVLPSQPELERPLDEIKEVWPLQTGEYLKREAMVECAGAAVACLVYEVAEAHAKGKVIIASGD